MSTAVFDPRTNARPVSPPLGGIHPDIFASTQIRAESSRVLQALSIPEYMEAWMQPPGIDRVEIHPDGRSFDRFTIALFSCSARLGSICGSCHLLKPNKITYVWERDCSAGRSLVEIWLWSYLGHCSLKLRHGQFTSRAEHDWHSSMWTCSFRRLRVLLEGTGVAAPTPLE